MVTGVILHKAEIQFTAPKNLNTVTIVIDAGDLQTILSRALNTWPDAPDRLVELYEVTTEFCTQDK